MVRSPWAQADLVERWLRWESPEIVSDFYRLRAEADEAIHAAAHARGGEAYPNHLFPEIAAVLPVILVSSTGRMRIPAPKTLLPRNIRLDYALAKEFLGSGDFASRTLADGDAEAEPMPTMLVPLSWEAVKRDVQAMVRQIAAD